MKRNWLIVGVLVLGLAGVIQAAKGAGSWEIAQRAEFSLAAVQGLPHSISPDGEFLLTWSNETGVCLYRTADLSPAGCFRPEVETDSPLWLMVPSITWAPDGSYFLFTTADARSWRADVASGEMESFPTSVVGERFAFSPDGEYLATGGDGAIGVAPPGALAEAPVARFEGILKGLVWCEAGLYYGVLAPDRKAFQLWGADPSGRTAPKLLWSYPDLGLPLVAVSPDGRYVWLGAGLVDLTKEEFVDLAGGHSAGGFAFSPDGGFWLYSYRAVVKDGGLRAVFRLAVRPAGTPRDEEEILYERGKPIRILGWAASNRVTLFLVHRDEPELVILDLAKEGG